MVDKLSTGLFTIGILILIINSSISSNIWSFISIILMVVAWILREVRENEGYVNAYDRARKTGYLVGGTVYASYPENVPGLGWI
jgi:hypothetical protein